MHLQDQHTMLGVKGKRILLTFHILVNATWLGAMVTIAFLVLTSRAVRDGDTVFAVNQAIFRLHDTVAVNLAFAVILTGLLFSMFTKWGFFDFYWIIVKWISLGALFVIVVFFLTPGVNTMAAIADVDRAQALNDPMYLSYRQITVLSSLSIIGILAAVTAISVFKPWGKRRHPFTTRRRTVLTIGIGIGASVTALGLLQYRQLQSYRAIEIADIEPAGIPDGLYVGTATCGYTYEVSVSIVNGSIEEVSVLSNRGGLYPTLAARVTEKVRRAQTPSVDAVTGATTTSKCLLKAVEQALIGTTSTPAVRPYPNGSAFASSSNRSER